MNEAIGQGGGMATLPPRSIGEILSAAFQLYRRHWRTLLAIAAVVVVPLTLLQYGIGHWFRTNGQQLHDPAEVSTSFTRMSVCLVAVTAASAVERAAVAANCASVAVRPAASALASVVPIRVSFVRTRS